MRRWGGRSSPPGLQAERELRALLESLPGPSTSDRGGSAEVDRMLLDLVALGRRFASEPAAAPGDDPKLLLRLARESLVRRLNGPGGGAVVATLAEEVLGGGRGQPLERRLEAVRALGEARPEAALGTLLQLATGEEPELAQPAVEALVGWPSPRVHQFFLEEFERGSDRDAARRHLLAARAHLGDALLDRLRFDLGRLYLGSDWRDAARAGRLVGILDTPRAVPVLIEALTTWMRRGEAGKGSKRIVEELVVELRRVSGRSIGADPASWNRWWSGVLVGDVLLPEEALARGEPLTRAEFFGLRLATDRVLFVVDRSGSMQEAFGTGGYSRYEEAVRQLFVFLESAGESTRFGVELFHDGGDRWRSRLVEANAANVDRARAWLDSKRPKGGTALQAGMFEALGADGSGRVAADSVEPDTIVVLCDGATAEGPGWVRPWLAEVQEDLQLVIHGVQIGSSGDGALEALAEGTGGTFLRIEP